MSENENGNSPQEDPTEVKTTIGMPTPPRPVEETESAPSSSEQSVAIPVVAEEASSNPIVEPLDISNTESNEGSALVWPIDADHANAVSVLSEQMSGVKVFSSGYVHEQPSRALNFILLTLVVVVGIAGSLALKHYSSSDREARLMEKAICKADYVALTELTKQRQYGTLVIESAPEQAKVLRSVDGSPMEEIMGKTADGKEMATLTPATLKDLDINKMYKFKLRFTDTLKRPKELTDEEKKALKEGEKPPVEEMDVDYRDEVFEVARYQWIKDGATGSFRFQKIVPMTPDYIEYYYTFNWSKGKEARFEGPGGLAECEAYQKENDASICRGIPRSENFEKKDAREEAEKKGRKRGRRRR